MSKSVVSWRFMAAYPWSSIGQRVSANTHSPTQASGPSRATRHHHGEKPAFLKIIEIGHRYIAKATIAINQCQRLNVSMDHPPIELQRLLQTLVFWRFHYS